MKVLDCHHHVWDLDVVPQPWLWEDDQLAPLRQSFALADLRATAGEQLEGTVVVQTVHSRRETSDLLALAAADPLVRGVVGWVDLTAPDVPDRLAALRAQPGGDRLVGIRHLAQSEPDPGWLLRNDVVDGVRAIGAAGLAFDLLVRPPQLPAAVELAARLPEVRMVLDHCGKPPVAARERQPWATLVRRLAAHEQVACKLSGLVTEDVPGRWTVDALDPYVATVLDAFGPERTMFGSDWPVCLVATDWSGWLDAARQLTAQLSPTERDAVFAGTGRTHYRLG